MAFTFASGCLRKIVCLISSTHHMLQPVEALSESVQSSLARVSLTSQLNLPMVSDGKGLELSDVVFEWGAVDETAKGVQHLWDSII